MAYTRKNSPAPTFFSRPSTTPPRAKTPRVPSTFVIARAPFQFYAWTPAPLHQRITIQLIRWQLLAVMDTRWEFCPASLVVPASRNHAAHLATLIHHTTTNVVRPRAWRIRTFRPERPSAARHFFERLQTSAAFIPGHVTPHCAHSRALHQLARVCQSGRADPRRHFLPLAIALARVISCIQFANTEPVTSPAGWGCWIPWEKFDQHMEKKSNDDQINISPHRPHLNKPQRQNQK